MLPGRAARSDGRAAPESFDQALSFTDSGRHPSHQMKANDPDPASAQSGDLASLMAAIRGGSESALGRLMDLYWPELVRYAASQLGDVDLARDVAQEAFIQVWERRRTWRPRGSARAYLYHIARHLVIDQKRKRAVRRRWLDRQGREDATRGEHTANPGRSARRQAARRQVSGRGGVAARPPPRGVRARLPARALPRRSGRRDERLGANRCEPDVQRRYAPFGKPWRQPGIDETDARHPESRTSLNRERQICQWQNGTREI